MDCFLGLSPTSHHDQYPLHSSIDEAGRERERERGREREGEREKELKWAKKMTYICTPIHTQGPSSCSNTQWNVFNYRKRSIGSFVSALCLATFMSSLLHCLTGFKSETFSERYKLLLTAMILKS